MNRLRELLAIVKSLFVVGPVATYKVAKATHNARKIGMQVYLSDVRSDEGEG